MFLRNLITVLSLMAITFTACNSGEKDNAGSKQNDNSDNSGYEFEGFDGKPVYRITVTQGESELGKMKAELYPEIAPKHVRNFDSLVAIDFYDGTAFHRVIPGFMIQGGDPNSKDKPMNTWGRGDPSQKNIPAEFNDMKHVKGVISAARSSDPNSATSQFFIMHANAPHLDGKYTAYGKVIEGIEIVDKIAQVETNNRDYPVEKVEMEIIRLK